jgi:hypothetical protein
MQILSARHVKTEESLRLGVVSGWYSTKVSGTFVTGPHTTQEDCLSKILELNPPPAKKKFWPARHHLFNRGVPDMALTQSHFQEYDFNRMVVLFTMKNDEATVSCAISTDAMDQLEGSSRTPPAQRQQQFLRLRERIEERAARKFSDVELEGNPPGVILRAIDFRAPL